MAVRKIPESVGLDASDFPGHKLPADMSLDELLAAMREIMEGAFTHSFNSDVSYFVWDELDWRMCDMVDQPQEWRTYY